MSYLLQLSIVIIVSLRLCLTQELNELNICDTQTQITVEHAFRFHGKLVAFVKLNSSETVYVIKVRHNVSLWNDWNVYINGSVEDELENFEHVFVREDESVTYVVYLKSGRYYRVEYNQQFTRISHIHDTDIANSDDSLQIAIQTYFKDSLVRYITSMRFLGPGYSPIKALVYKTTLSAIHYIVMVFTNTYPLNGEHKWTTRTESLRFELSENTRIVSAFHLHDYVSIGANEHEFHFVEISSNGSYRVNRVVNSLENQDIKYGFYSNDKNIRQLFKCELMSTLSSNTTTTSLSPSSQTTANTMSTMIRASAAVTQPNNNNKWLYIIAAIILLLIIAAIIVLMWCCCCRRNRKSKSVENGSQENEHTSKSIAEDDETVRSDTGIDSSDTGNRPQTESPNTKSGASQQSH